MWIRVGDHSLDAPGAQESGDTSTLGAPQHGGLSSGSAKDATPLGPPGTQESGDSCTLGNSPGSDV